MSAITVTFGQLAQAALTVMAEASIKADDGSIEMTRAARQMLRGIVDGSLTVAPAAASATNGGAALGADGVVPAGGSIPPGALA